MKLSVESLYNLKEIFAEFAQIGIPVRESMKTKRFLKRIADEIGAIDSTREEIMRRHSGGKMENNIYVVPKKDEPGFDEFQKEAGEFFLSMANIEYDPIDLSFLEEEWWLNKNDKVTVKPWIIATIEGMNKFDEMQKEEENKKEKPSPENNIIKMVDPYREGGDGV